MNFEVGRADRSLHGALCPPEQSMELINALLLFFFFFFIALKKSLLSYWRCLSVSGCYKAVANACLVVKWVK